MMLEHATCIELNGKGILIVGDSGSGKSDLAIRLIDSGGILVSDDYVELIEKNNKLIAKTAPNIGGMIEVRGVGLIKINYKERTNVELVLKLTERKQISRLPETEYFEYGNAKVRQYIFDPFANSAIAKIKLLLR